MFIFGALPVCAGIQNDNDKYYKTQSQEHEDARLIFPDLLNAARQLGPIHVLERYTPAWQK